MVDVRTASREALLAVIARQQRELLALHGRVAEQRAEIVRLHATVAEQRVTIGRLEARLRDLEAGSGKGGRASDAFDQCRPSHNPTGRLGQDRQQREFDRREPKRRLVVPRGEPGLTSTV